MADYADKPQPKAKPSDEDDVIKTARDRWDRAYEKERDNIDAAYEDLQFLSGSQWPAEIAQERENDSRPVLTVNRLPQFVHQITGDIRQMKPAIKAVPVDDAADEQVAGLLGGLIRYIENRSDATGVYFQAADQQVPAGIGHWRVLTEYADDSTFEQEIRIASVDDGISVLWDPDAKRLTREDGQYCFVPFDFNAKAFKEKYPDADSAGFETLNNWANLGDWYSDDHVRVCEYWVKKPIKRTLALTVDGKVLDLTDEDKEQQALAKSMGARIEQRDSYKVCRYLITACEVLEGPTEWPGRYIPIARRSATASCVGRRTRSACTTMLGPRRPRLSRCSPRRHSWSRKPTCPSIRTFGRTRTPRTTLICRMSLTARTAGRLHSAFRLPCRLRALTRPWRSPRRI
jgi:hypothetical protein